ncbi:MAG: TlpA family protein disulfide reductase [Actinobacteria bacterium]|nr:TlpA family protein disulfide reductase [Actinomycetota bacterium]
MTRRRSLALVVLALIVPSCSGGSTPADTPTPAINATEAALLPVTTGALPEMDFQRFQKLLLQLRGTPVVVNIWGSWCGPCRAEAPHLASAARTYGDRVQFVGVDILDRVDAARSFMREFEIPYPSVFDPTGGIRSGLGFVGQPITIFYDANGKMVSAIPGPSQPSELLQGILRILPPQTSTSPSS